MSNIYAGIGITLCAFLFVLIGFFIGIAAASVILYHKPKGTLHIVHENGETSLFLELDINKEDICSDKEITFAVNDCLASQK